MRDTLPVFGADNLNTPPHAEPVPTELTRDWFVLLRFSVFWRNTSFHSLSSPSEAIYRSRQVVSIDDHTGWGAA